MRYSDFCYIDHASGGANKRNNVIKIDALSVDASVADCYATMFRFNSSYYEHWKTNHTVKGAGNLICWADCLWFDIDASYLACALKDAQTLVRGLQQLTGDDALVVFFSGSKGFHIGVNSDLFGFEPSIELPQQMRQMGLHLAGLFGVTVDKSIYNLNRLWRLPNTKHGKTGLYKTQLDARTFITMSMDDITKRAAVKKRPKPSYFLSSKAQPNERLVQLRTELNAAKPAGTMTMMLPVLEGKPLQAVLLSLKKLLAQGVGAGGRDDAGLLRAAECRKAGFDESETRERLYTWNELNQPPMDEVDVERIIKSAYSRVYDFGYDNAELKEAREEAWEAIKSGNVDESELAEESPSPEVDENGIPTKLTLEQFYSYFPAPVEQEHDEDPLPRFPTWQDLIDHDYKAEDLEPIGPHITWRQQITVLVGQAKYAGKSTLCTYETVCAAKAGARVLWVSPDESLRQLVKRFETFNGVDVAGQFMFLSDRYTPASLQHLLAAIVFFKPDIVILDSVHSISKLWNGKKEVPDHGNTVWWQNFINQMRPVATACHCAVVWIHHAAKGTNKSIGSVGIEAGADMIVILSNPSNNIAATLRKMEYMGREVSHANNKDIKLDVSTNTYGVVEKDTMARNSIDEPSPVDSGPHDKYDVGWKSPMVSRKDRFLFDLLSERLGEEVPLVEIKAAFQATFDKPMGTDLKDTYERFARNGGHYVLSKAASGKWWKLESATGKTITNASTLPIDDEEDTNDD